MARNTHKPPLAARTAHARREAGYWAGRACRSALRAARRRIGNATFWSASGTAALATGFAVWLRAFLAWNRAEGPGAGAWLAAIIMSAGIVQLYIHGEAKRRRGRD